MRRFTPEDAGAFFELMRDGEVNTFPPLFPFERLEDARAYLQEKYLQSYAKPTGFRYAVLLSSGRPGLSQVLGPIPGALH